MTNIFRAMILLLVLSYTVPLGALSAPASTGSAKTEAKTVSKNQQTSQSFPNDVVGNWVSDWGPVSFSKDSVGTVNGAWEEGKNKKGQIRAGKFTPATGSLNFDFCETWTGLKGKALLKLSDDHRELSGTWTRGKGQGKDKGTWTMHRPKKDDLLK